MRDSRLLGDRAATREFFQRPVIRNCSRDMSRVSAEDAADVIRAVSHCPVYLPIQLAFLRDGPLTGLENVTAPTSLTIDCARQAWSTLSTMLGTPSRSRRRLRMPFSRISA